MSGAAPTHRVLRAGAPARRALLRALAATAALVLVFYAVTWGSKYWPPLYRVQPWSQDPYQGAVYFDLVLLPVLVAAGLARSLLCRPQEPLLVRRAEDLLRVAWLAVGMVVATELAEWVAVARGGMPAGAAGVGQVVALGVLSVAAAVVVGLLAAAHRSVSAATATAVPGPAPDWLDDALQLCRAGLTPVAGLLPAVRQAPDWLDRVLVRRVRRHPVRSAVAASLALALVADAAQIVLEGYGVLMAAVFVGMSASGLLAFLLLGGAYLRLVRTSGRPRTVGVDALVVAALVVPVVAVFRDPLWTALGTDSTAAGAPQLAELLAVTAVVAFAAVWLAEQVVRHRPGRA